MLQHDPNLHVFRCRHEQNCVQCGEMILPNDQMFPVLLECKKVWIHGSCAESQPELLDPANRPVCKHWIREGSCIYKKSCYFSHPDEAANTLEKKRTWGGRRLKVRNDGRANIFRRWMLETLQIGGDDLVLDVAAGKGELSFLLSNLSGVPVLAIEPRNLSLKCCSKKFSYGMFHRTKILSDKENLRDHTDVIRKIPQLKMCLQDDLVKSLQNDPEEKTINTIEKALHSASALTWTRKGLHENGSAEPWLKAEFDPDSAVLKTNPHEILSLFRSATCVVAMHPDQATQAAVDLALYLEIPFAVVPCCVYHSSFPSRKLTSGKPVKSYEDLVAYLQEKAVGVKTATLGFEGRNTVVYWVPPRSSSCCS